MNEATEQLHALTAVVADIEARGATVRDVDPSLHNGKVRARISVTIPTPTPEEIADEVPVESQGAGEDVDADASDPKTNLKDGVDDVEEDPDPDPADDPVADEADGRDEDDADEDPGGGLQKDTDDPDDSDRVPEKSAAEELQDGSDGWDDPAEDAVLIREFDAAGEQLADRLREAGYETAQDVADADVDALAGVPYVGETRAEGVYEEAVAIVDGGDAGDEDIKQLYSAKTPSDTGSQRAYHLGEDCQCLSNSQHVRSHSLDAVVEGRLCDECAPDRELSEIAPRVDPADDGSVDPEEDGGADDAADQIETYEVGDELSDADVEAAEASAPTESNEGAGDSSDLPDGVTSGDVHEAIDNNDTLGDVADELDLTTTEARTIAFRLGRYADIRDVSGGYGRSGVGGDD